VSNFYGSLPLEAAQQLEQLSRLAFELRENRKELLQQHGVDSEDALLALVCSGAVAEHPGYDHYLGAQVISATRAAVRSQLQAVLIELGGG
jgi:hypothetical protein